MDETTLRIVAGVAAILVFGLYLVRRSRRKKSDD